MYRRGPDQGMIGFGRRRKRAGFEAVSGGMRGGRTETGLDVQDSIRRAGGGTHWSAKVRDRAIL